MLGNWARWVSNHKPPSSTSLVFPQSPISHKIPAKQRGGQCSIPNVWYIYLQFTIKMNRTLSVWVYICIDVTWATNAGWGVPNGSKKRALWTSSIKAWLSASCATWTLRTMPWCASQAMALGPVGTLNPLQEVVPLGVLWEISSKLYPGRSVN